MNDAFTRALILAYFNTESEYSLYELHDLIGISMSELENIIDDLMQCGLIAYNKNQLLAVTDSGLKFLEQNGMEAYRFDNSISDAVKLDEIWPIDKAYPVHEFSRKKWRGSDQ